MTQGLKQTCLSYNTSFNHLESLWDWASVSCILQMRRVSCPNCTINQYGTRLWAPVLQLLGLPPCLAGLISRLRAACWSLMWPQLLLRPWAVLGVIKGNSGISNFLRSTASSFLKNLGVPLLTTKIDTICFYNRVVIDGRFIMQRPCCDSFWKVTCQET